MVEVVIENCPHKISFTPKVVYPGIYFTLGRCSLVENKIPPEMLVKVQINGGENNNNKIPAKCLFDCPLR